MSSSHLFKTSDPRLTNIMRQYSDYFNLKQGGLESFPMSQSSHPQMYHLHPSDPRLTEYIRRGSDVPSLIEELIRKPNIYSANLNLNVNPARPVLVNAYQRIFQYVINLMMEIAYIKYNIQKEKYLTIQMEVYRDSILNSGDQKDKKKATDLYIESIINKLKNKYGYELQISLAQLYKFSTDNEQLYKSITRLKIKSRGNLHQVLEYYRTKFRALQQRLQERNDNQNSRHSNYGNNTYVLQYIQRLQGDIERLEATVYDGSNIGFEIKRLNEYNQRLKERTMQLINASNHGSTENFQEAEERQKLEEYIRQEEENKNLFFYDLKRFKEEYLALKAENDELKQRLRRGSQQYPPRPVGDNQRLSGQGSKFIKYEDLMNEMNTVMK